MKFIDVEGGWVEDHEDFTFDNHFYSGGDPGGWDSDHGTAVLGEVIGEHNGYGISGFAPDVQYGTVAVNLDTWPDVARFFQEAIDNLDAGDVWLIELHDPYVPGYTYLPMEHAQAALAIVAGLTLD